MKRVVAIALLVLIAISIQPVFAGPKPPPGPSKPPLPPLPAQSIIDSVVSNTNGAVFTPMYAPNAMQTQWSSFGGIFSGVTLDVSLAVHYINTKGTLLETLVPVDGLESAALAPNITTPSSGGPGGSKPGLILGASYQKQAGARWVVLVFKTNGDPEKVRIYSSASSFNEAPLIKGTFADPNGDSQIEAVDAGALISDDRSCVTVSLNQVCWAPLHHEEIRDETKPSTKAKDAEEDFDAIYTVGTDFDAKNAVPDFYGQSLRQTCAAYLSGATSYTQMAACEANLVIAVAKTPGANKPVAILVLTDPADIRAYDDAGNYVGVLPADSYLVMTTPASSTLPGTPTALFLIGLSGDNYLVPSTIMQGFASGNTAQAGIRDGFCAYRLFGW